MTGSGGLSHVLLPYSDHWFSQAFDSAPTGMVIVSLGGRVLYANRAFADLFGYSQPELLNADWRSLVCPDDITDDTAQARRLVSGETHRYRAERRFVRAGGQTAWGIVAVSVARDSSNRPLYFVGQVIDITERKRAEDETQLLQTLTLAINVSQDVNSALVMLLRTVCEATGWPLGQAWLRSNDGSCLECSAAWYTKSAGTERFREMSEKLRFVPGAGLPGRVWFERAPVWLPEPALDRNFPRAQAAIEAGLKAGVGIPVLAGDEPVAVIEFFMQDAKLEDERLIMLIWAVAAQLGALIQQKHAEEALRRSEENFRSIAQELARSNAELEQFAYVASHDLQEPLRMVASYCKLLEQRYAGKLDEKADRFINYAVDGATRMQKLINDLLAYSRVGARRSEFGLTDCHKALAKALTNLTAAIKDTGTLITFDPMPAVNADESQLIALFQNLIANGIKFRADSPPCIHISVEHSDSEFLFSVSDNGIGIDPQFFDRIFVIFQRLHARTEYPGTGMGLAICKKIVERHGGRIWLQSEAGRGSTFYFTFPATELE